VYAVESADGNNGIIKLFKFVDMMVDFHFYFRGFHRFENDFTDYFLI